GPGARGAGPRHQPGDPLRRLPEPVDRRFRGRSRGRPAPPRARTPGGRRQRPAGARFPRLPLWRFRAARPTAEAEDLPSVVRARRDLRRGRGGDGRLFPAPARRPPGAAAAERGRSAAPAVPARRCRRGARLALMLLFWVIAAIMMAAAVALVVRPLLRARGQD